MLRMPVYRLARYFLFIVELNYRPETVPWTFTQLQFLGWGAHVVPDVREFYQFLETYSHLRAEKPLSSDFGPTIVHCSAGVGRTGTLICADMLLNQLRTKPSRLDVFGTVLASRIFRRNLVQVKAPATLTVNPSSGGLAQDAINDQPKSNQFTGPSLAQPTTFAAVQPWALPSQAPATLTVPPLSGAFAQNEVHDVPNGNPTNGASLAQPSAFAGLPTRTVPPQTPGHPSVPPMPRDVPHQEEYDVPKGHDLYDVPAQPSGAPRLPPKTMVTRPVSQQVSIDAQNGRFVLPGQSRPGKFHASAFYL
ncbi:unnamed protein product [Dibothriocephalus latus]|uniref:Tyrosine specific protein phosphatases domain-containing protein n=1 Tax=Dibothriocephalus latus TaxID=60516 RepID=A0A3P6TUB1_DIBLA|nr:unnamed protein product [Dibothriocephalus latus]